MAGRQHLPPSPPSHPSSFPSALGGAGYSPALGTGSSAPRAPYAAVLAAALLAAKSEAAAAQERVRVAAWELERATADALARRVAEAEHYILLSSGQQLVVPFDG